MPLSSTRICPNFALLVTAIFSPVAAALADGLEAAVDGLDSPHAAPSNEITATATPNSILARMPRNTRPGYARYSGVTYAAVVPPSTRKGVPFTQLVS